MGSIGIQPKNDIGSIENDIGSAGVRPTNYQFHRDLT